MQRYRFLLTFRWILLTSLVAIAVVVMVRLGFWQLDRLHTRQAANALITARQSEPVTDIGAVVDLDASPAAVDDVVKRQVTVTGTYKPEDQVLIRNRSNNTAPGFWVITPVVAADGTAVAVNRGWIPITIGDGGSPDQYAPPSGPVTVTGIVQKGEVAHGLEANDPSTGRLATLSRVDLGRIGQQLPYKVRPAWIELRDQQPAQSGVLPVKVTPAPIDEGPHLNYAGQWFIFATLTCIVFPMAVRRAAKAREARQREIEAEAMVDDRAPPAPTDDVIESLRDNSSDNSSSGADLPV